MELEYDNIGVRAGIGGGSMSQDGALHDGAYMNGEQAGNDMTRADYELPAAESTRHSSAKPNRPPKSSKKSKGDKAKAPSNETYYSPPAPQTNFDAPAVQANYYAPAAQPNHEAPAQPSYDAPLMQPSYDAPASQHGYYEPPAAQNGGYPDEEAPPVAPPPRTTSKAESSKHKGKSGSGLGNVFASLRRSFSKKKKPATASLAPEQQSVLLAEPPMPNAFTSEPEQQNVAVYAPSRADVSPQSVQPPEANGSSPNRASTLEPGVDLVKMRKKKKKEEDEARMTASSRRASVDNLRDARQKMILVNVQPVTTTAHARVIMLDGEEVNFSIDKWVNADVLFAKVCDRVNVDVVDQDFFGLTYIQELKLPDPTDKSKKKMSLQQVWFWLDLTKPIYKQQPDFSKWEFRFQVKFYPPEPTMMREDLSRYQLCLQLRQDLYYGKLPCAWVVHALLGSYTVQSELGDYEDIAELHAADMQSEAFEPQVPASVRYIQNFAFLPGQSVELLERIAELHRTHKGLTPAEADVRFLENAKRLPLYGVDLHSLLDAADTEIQLGISYYGIVVYRNGVLLNKFAWPKIVKVAFKRYHFYLYPRAESRDESTDEIEFRLADKRLAKRLWTIAVEHHTFWRLKSPDLINKKMNNFARKAMSLLSLTESSSNTVFRFSGRTLFEQRKLKDDADQHDTERGAQSVKFDRLASKRISASMPHLVNAGRGASSQQLNASPDRMKAAQSMTSLVLPPPRIGSLRDVRGSSRVSVRGSQNLPPQIQPTVQTNIEAAPALPPAQPPALPTAPAPERQRSKKPLPVPPPVQEPLVLSDIPLNQQANPPRSPDYSKPAKSSKPKKSLSKKDSKKDAKKKRTSDSDYAPVQVAQPQPEPDYLNTQHLDSGPEEEPEPEPEAQPLIHVPLPVDEHPSSLVDDGYEHLRDVASPLPFSENDSLRKRRGKTNKLKVTFSDSETEIDRIPANFAEQSTLDSDTTYSNSKPLPTPPGVTDLDHSGPESRDHDQHPTYVNSAASVAAPLKTNVPVVDETNLDDDFQPVKPTDSSLESPPPLPSTLPPEPSAKYEVEYDDGDTL